MLTGELGITAGTAYLHGYNIQTQLKEVQQRIGYCPQVFVVDLYHSLYTRKGSLLWPKNYPVCAEFPDGSKFHLSKWESNHCTKNEVFH